MPKDVRRRFSDSDHEESSPEASDVCAFGFGVSDGTGVLKPDVSYIEMIARVILSSHEKKLCLQDIYDGIERLYPFFRSAPPRWRNSVRHNLSLHECFCKGERCENGKGHYWCIHPANLEDFLRGDFRRRLIKSRVRQMQQCHALYMQYQLAFSRRPDLYQYQVSPVALRALQQPSFHFIQALPTYSRAAMPYVQPLVCYNSQALISVPTSTDRSASTEAPSPNEADIDAEQRPANKSANNSPRKSSAVFSVESILSTP